MNKQPSKSSQGRAVVSKKGLERAGGGELSCSGRERDRAGPARASAGEGRGGLHPGMART